MRRFFLKKWCIKAISTALKVLWVMPVKTRKITFISYGGRQYACNPRAISDRLLQKYPECFEQVWMLRGIPATWSSQIKVAPVGFISLIYHLLTAHIIITNDTLPTYFTKRKGQLVINTWHGGGAYKQIDLGNNDPTSYDAYFAHKLRRNTDAYISSCKLFSTMEIRGSFGFQGTILEIGMPRNDAFFSKRHCKMREAVRSKYKVPEELRIALYAPSFRGENAGVARGLSIDGQMDFRSCLDALRARFGSSFVMFMRTHHSITEVEETEGCVNVSDYPEMQELLAAADVLFTDCSSSIWDFSFLRRPCFLYFPDLVEYEKEHTFYTPIRQWPFPCALTNQALVEIIAGYDGDVQAERVRMHHAELGSFESGIATDQVIRYIFDVLGEPKQSI